LKQTIIIKESQFSAKKTLDFIITTKAKNERNEMDYFLMENREKPAVDYCI
jgi:hypothetical protein